MNAIETRELSKVFGNHTAVNHLNLSVPHGSVFGFLGPNGAGKTTTLRMLVGLAKPTAGQAFVLGHPISDKSHPYLRRIGFLPDVPAFYDWMRPKEFLAMMGEVFGLSGRALKNRIDEVLEITGLKGINRRIGGFSRGMKQRLGLAQALINEPELIFLDEPTSALDPLGRKEVLEAIGCLSGRITVLFSTHILNDVERVCDTVAVLNNGCLVTQQRIQDLRQSFASQYIYLEVDGDVDVREQFAGQPVILQAEPFKEGWRIQPSDVQSAKMQLPGLIHEKGLALKRFELLEPSLEDIFVRLVNGT